MVQRDEEEGRSRGKREEKVRKEKELDPGEF